jgi:hypothetical protein
MGVGAGLGAATMSHRFESVAEAARARGLNYDWLRRRIRYIPTQRVSGRLIFQSGDLDAHLALFPKLPLAAHVKQEERSIAGDGR